MSNCIMCCHCNFNRSETNTVIGVSICGLAFLISFQFSLWEYVSTLYPCYYWTSIVQFSINEWYMTLVIFQINRHFTMSWLFGYHFFLLCAGMWLPVSVCPLGGWSAEAPAVLQRLPGTRVHPLPPGDRGQLPPEPEEPALSWPGRPSCRELHMGKCIQKVGVFLINTFKLGPSLILWKYRLQILFKSLNTNKNWQDVHIFPILITRGYVPACVCVLGHTGFVR